ncbi:hypothetical protein L7F22_061643 [Adiantum nelumboides]|nr:hypothetical protein [Adiantum nelumboides]
MAMVEFEEAYSQYLETQPPSFPTLSYHRLHALLVDCTKTSVVKCTSGCFGCDDNFFPVLRKEVAAVSRYFNTRVRWLLRIHLASGVTKCILHIKSKHARDYLAMIQEGQRLVKHVSMTTLATRQLLEKYDKVHTSREGSKFRTWLMAVHVEALQSPWLVELLALYFNLKLNKARSTVPEICPGSTCDLQSGKPMLSCLLHETLRLEVDVTCSICLEIVYEPVALNCGHIFCFKCACCAASVSTVNGFKKAKKCAKCPLCREPGVFSNAFHLRELEILVNRSCKDYCKKRLQKERKEHLKQKDSWSYRPPGLASYGMV